MSKLSRSSLRQLVCVALVSMLSIVPLLAQSELSAQAVMDKVFSAAKPKGSIETLAMTISKGGQSLNRSMTMWSQGDNAKGQVEKVLVKFSAPADVKGSAFLSLKKADGNAETMIWLPALGRVRRLGSSGSDQDQAFFGSDFTNRDINGFIEADFSFKTLSTSGSIYTIEATPTKNIGYEKLVYQVDSSIWRYVKIEYWHGGKVAKTQTADYVKVGDYQLPAHIAMASASGSTTSMSFTDHKVDQDLSDSLFTERGMKD